MKPQFDHQVKTSFTLWLDNLLLRKGAGFTNYSTSLTKILNAQPSDFDVFKSPHPQWVYDSSIANATVPTGVTIGSTVTPRSDDVVLDFNNGRVLVAKNLSATSVSASYSFKDIAVYPAQIDEKALLFENKFVLNPRTKTVGPAAEIEWTYPAIFVRYNPGLNEPYCLGGTDITHPKIRTILIMDSTYLFDGACGILRDTVRTGIPLLMPEELPFDAYGDFKDGVTTFDFPALMATKQGTDIMFISRVTVSPFSEQVNTEIGGHIIAGFVDFELDIYRQPRA